MRTRTLFAVISSPLVTIAFLGAAVAPAHAGQLATRVSAPSMYRAILPALHHTGVPALLPTSGIPRSKYAALVFAQKGQYEVTIGYVPNCAGHACEWGTLDAVKVKGRAHRLPGKTIPLARGVTGYWLPFTCGANCSDSTIAFDRNGFRYIYGVKAGKLKEVLPLANSALQSGPA